MECIRKRYLPGDEDCHGSAKHDLPDSEIIPPNLPDSYEHEHGCKNDNRNIRRTVFLVIGDEPWHSHAPLKKGRKIKDIPSTPYIYYHQSEDQIPVPGFPSAFLPASMIIGMLGVVLLFQRIREN
jgi:hypothetical protein